LSNYLIFDKQFITYIVILYKYNSFTEIKNLRCSWPLRQSGNRVFTVHCSCSTSYSKTLKSSMRQDQGRICKAKAAFITARWTKTDERRV